MARGIRSRAGKAAAMAPPPGAVEAPLPDRLAPQLATLVRTPPSTGEWTYELKFDGYRLMARLDADPQLLTRSGIDWTAKMPALASELVALGLAGTWLDGEAVVLGDNGLPSFNALQNAFDKRRSDAIVFFVFDAPYFQGLDLRNTPLKQRRDLLRTFFAERSSERVRFSDDLVGDGPSLLQSACKLGLEGVMAKRGDARYVSARSVTWIKLKCGLRQELVVVGFTDRAGAPLEVGSLLLGYHEAGALRYAGSVGTGWDSAASRDLRKRLQGLQIEAPAIDPRQASPGRWSRRAAGGEHWVRPAMVVEVAFTEWTPDGKVRHAAFKGLRQDKTAASVTRELPKAAAPQRKGPKRIAAASR